MSDKPKYSVGWPVTAGLFAIVVFFGGFGAWAMTAMISGAAVTMGTLVATGQNKVVQHLEGGIVKSIVVAEGDRIKAGAPVLILDDTQAQANLNRLTVQKDVLTALAARLEAERRSESAVTFPESLAERADNADTRDLLDDQRQEFKARYERYQKEIGILRKRVLALQEEIAGLEAQIKAGETQLTLIKEEHTALHKLFRKGLARKERLLALKRSEADLQGQNGEYRANIAKARQTIAETELQIARAANVRVEQANSELTRVRGEIAGIDTQIAAARDVLDRIVVRAPTSGSVVRLGVHTDGAVIRPGQEILEILPENAELLIEAQVKPEDIDLVHKGQDAMVRLSALDRRTTPNVDAVVTYVSADLIVKKETQVPYYLARLRFKDLEATGIRLKDLYPGMTVEAYLRTEDRTFLQYIAKPILDSLQKSFREE